MIIGKSRSREDARLFGQFRLGEHIDNLDLAGLSLYEFPKEKEILLSAA